MTLRRERARRDVTWGVVASLPKQTGDARSVREGPRHFRRMHTIQFSRTEPDCRRLDIRSAFRESRLRRRCLTSAASRLVEGGNFRLPRPLRQPIFFGPRFLLRCRSASSEEERAPRFAEPRRVSVRVEGRRIVLTPGPAATGKIIHNETLR